MKNSVVLLSGVINNTVWTYLMERFPQGKFNSNASLFLNDENLYAMNRDSLRHLLKNLGKRAGVIGVHPHRFRHTFAV